MPRLAIFGCGQAPDGAAAAAVLVRERRRPPSRWLLFSAATLMSLPSTTGRLRGRPHLIAVSLLSNAKSPYSGFSRKRSGVRPDL
jgi:hypothetical protein